MEGVISCETNFMEPPCLVEVVTIITTKDHKISRSSKTF